MLKSRDRHNRGLRGRLAWPNPYTGAPVPLRSRQTKAEFFTMCVHDALTQIQEHCPRALAGIDVGIEDVPVVGLGWTRERVPLAAAVSATPEVNGQVVVFRRPLERRARTRQGLRILVFRTIVEQLSEATAIPVDEIDPQGHREDDDWD
ncbi:metallopeptidase family protein [Propioniciclava sinopodophylli]|uniref:Metallopeptidase family protein n=1 Tax=Propioniciclava sinopodophylli TaxID=1837344 RepID=A0A4Q9KF28_9ACTN|nr:metallopeptidase family protein [Propioniciclava sinopodophylli]TBT86559.1 metallopeptidase family protein [Propioniciclava sinopodophylli]